MRTNLAELQREADLLFGTISMRMNYRGYGKEIQKSKVLLVEGRTDQQFIDQYIKPDVLSQIGNCTFRNMCNGTRGQNAKRAIIRIVEGSAKFKALLRIPPRMQQVEIAGMVDRDFDDPASYARVGDLFITDTHDLETLILSTDQSLLKQLNDCPLSDEDIQRSLFMAYQIGVALPVLHARKIDTRSISGGDTCADYNAFFDDKGRISLVRLLQCVLGSKKEAEKSLLGMVRHKVVKLKFDKGYCWKGDFPSFRSNIPDDLWEKANGHDVLSLIMFHNPNAALKFNAQCRLNRKFEMAIIEGYKKDNFKRTNLFGKMLKRGVV